MNLPSSFKFAAISAAAITGLFVLALNNGASASHFSGIGQTAAPEHSAVQVVIVEAKRMTSAEKASYDKTHYQKV